VINPLGRLAALVSIALAGALVSTVLRGFHAQLLGIRFGPVDTIFSGMGLLALAGGLYARLSLRGVRIPQTHTEETGAAGTAQRTGGTSDQDGNMAAASTHESPVARGIEPRVASAGRIDGRGQRAVTRRAVRSSRSGASTRRSRRPQRGSAAR
jgi:hypothetical protein